MPTKALDSLVLKGAVSNEFRQDMTIIFPNAFPNFQY